MQNPEENCPICGNKKYLNPNMKIMISSCYHTICNACVERIFFHGSSKCPTCGAVLRKSNFKNRVIDDLEVEKECGIRKVLSKVYNKNRKQFKNIIEYNEYLEMIEDYVQKLLKNPKDPVILSKIEKYKRDNKELIKRNILLMLEKDRKDADYIKRMREKQAKMSEESFIMIEINRISMEAAKKEITEEIEASDRPASLIIAKKNKETSLLNPKNNHDSVSPTLNSAQNINERYELHQDMINSPAIGKEPYDPKLAELIFEIPINPLACDEELDEWLKKSYVIAGGITKEIIFKYAVNSLRNLYKENYILKSHNQHLKT